jgi:hypothetical protein
MSPPNTDPRPKENIDENANKDIGNPRLEHLSTRDVGQRKYPALLMWLPYIGDASSD